MRTQNYFRPSSGLNREIGEWGVGGDQHTQQRVVSIFCPEKLEKQGI